MSKALQRYIRSESVKERIEEVLGRKAPQFTTSMLTAVNNNIKLQDAEPRSVVTAAMSAASLDLPINPNLGLAYIIPYNNKKKIKELQYFTNDEGEREPKLDNNGNKIYKETTKWITEAQFQIGYKGFIQLAQRSGHFKRINATEVCSGELIGENQLSGELEFKFEKDREVRKKLDVIGYVAYFKLNNGFEKELYMDVEAMTAHAKRYSKSYKSGYGLWTSDFDMMAKKTVLKLLISKYGALSIDLQTAVEADQSSLDGDDYNYVDNKPDEEEVIDVEEVQKSPSDDVSQDPEDERAFSCDNENCDKSYKSKGGLAVHKGKDHANKK